MNQQVSPATGSTVWRRLALMACVNPPGCKTSASLGCTRQGLNRLRVRRPGGRSLPKDSRVAVARAFPG